MGCATPIPLTSQRYLIMPVDSHLLFSVHNFVLSTQLADHPYAPYAASLFVPSQPVTSVASQTRLRKCKMLKNRTKQILFCLTL
jgi:hypothetical protein